MDFSIISSNFSLYLNGLWMTVQLVGLSLVVGLGLAVLFALASHTGRWYLRWPILVYSYCFRGTPLLVQIFLLYYGLGQFEWLKTTVAWPFLSQAYWCALIAFTLNTAAYTTEILRGALDNTPRGEVEAALACGMSHALLVRRIVLPSAFRRALPAYANEVIFMLHGSAVASVITLMDITGVAQFINSRYYSPYEAYLTAAAFYLVLSLLIVWGFKRLEQRWFAHLRARSG